MKNGDRTKRQLLDELKEMRRRISELENLEEERSQAMEALREREQLNRALTGQSLVGVFVYQGGRIIYSNEAAAKIIGYSVDGILSPEFGGLQEFIHPQDLPFLMEQAAKKERGEKDSVPRYSYRVMTKSGEVRWIEVFSQPLTYRGGNAICGVIIDITERKQAEEALRESHELLSAIESTAVEGLIITDRDCNVLWHNKQVRGAKGDVVGEKCCRVFHGRESRCPFCVHPEIYADGEVREYESVVETQAGPGRTVWVRAAPIRDASGEIVAVLEASRDVTEHKQAEDALRESEERFRVMFDNSHDLMTITNADAEILWANEAWKRTFAYDPEARGDPLEKIHPADREKVRAAWESLLRGEREITNLEYRSTAASGNYVEVESTARTLTAAGKRFVSVIAHDVTERKRAEKALRESERRYRLLAENATDVIWTTDMNLRFTYISPSVTRLTGYSVTQAKALELAELLTPSSLEVARSAFAEEIAAEPAKGEKIFRSRTLELQLRCRDGSTVWTEARMTFLRDASGRAVGILGVARDITERRKAEEALRIKDSAIASSIEGITIVDLQGNLTYVNQSFLRMWGYDSESRVLGRPIVKFFQHESRASKVMRTLRDRGNRVGRLPAKRKDGSIFYVQLSASVVTDDTGEPVCIMASFLDVTRQKAAELELRQERNFISKVLDTAGALVIVLDAEGRIVRYNRACEVATGYSFDEVKGKHIWDGLLRPEDIERVKEFFDWRQIDRTPQEGDAYLMTKRGGVRLVSWSTATLLDSEGLVEYIIATGIDVTEKRKMEEDLLRAQKLESLGILAGGIAHDFNNLLGAILANISLAERHAEPGTMAFERLSEARKAALRARNLTQQLLTFSKGGEPVKRTASVAELLRDCAGFALQGSNLECDLHLPGDLWPVEIDEGQMYQVFNNLIINANEAIREGGRITVEAVNATVGRGSSLPLPAGKYVRVSITDQGVGISHENISRIFDPYFSTKRNGIGLGLAVAHAIVKKHDGHISVESELAVGTTFHVYLPASDEQPLTGREEALTTPRGEGRILLVEDEDVMRQAAAAVLDDLGYKVVLAKDGAQAVSAYKDARESGNPFDLVIMDLTMPGESGGKEAMGKLLEIDPDIKAIASSGYSDDPIMAAYKEYGFGAALAKPYDVDEMAAVVQEMMKTTA